MTKVDFAICGNAGFTVLRRHVEAFGVSAVGHVQVSADQQVTNDPAGDIITWCAKEQIPARLQSGFGHSENFCFFIGWPAKPPVHNRNIVFHEGLLPRYRGYAPLINSLISGEREIGVTALLASGPNDDGPLLDQEKIMVDYPLTIAEAINKITQLYITLVTSVYKKISAAKVLLTSEQDHYLATYCMMLHPSDYKVDWHKPAEVIKRTIDALGYPYAGVTSSVDGRQISITGARIIGDVVIENRAPGKVIFIHDGCPVIVCSTGLIAVTAATYNDTGESLIPVNDHKLLFH